jgi:predicted nucleic-acid-binding protein
MKYFIDTHILLDNFLNRQPFNLQSNNFFKKADIENWQLYVSDVTFLNSHYVLRKSLSNKLAVEVIIDFINQVEVVPVTKSILLAAATSNFNDFEDAVQFQCATTITGIDGIITRNKKGFKYSTIPVFAPEDVLF